MTHRALLICVNLITVLLLACDKKEILPGARESIAGVTETNELHQTSSHDIGVVTVTPATNVSSYVDLEASKQHVSLNYKTPTALQKLWKTSIGGERINSNIIAFNNHLYVVNSNGSLVCLSQNTGEKLWDHMVAKQPDSAIFSGGLTANGSTIYVSSNIGTVKAIDANTRKELWVANLKYPLKGVPLYSHGKIIINSIENQTFALDALTGSIAWVKSAAKEATTMASSGAAAESGNDVICPYTSGDLKSLNSQNGTINWEEVLFSTNFSESGAVFSQIAASPVVFNNNILVATSESKMVLLDAASGIRLWEKEIGTLNTPVVNNNWIFVLSSDNQVICLSAKTGEILWIKSVSNIYGEKYPDNSTWVGPLLINGDVVIFSNYGDILKLDLSTGNLKGKATIKNISINKKPIVVNGKIFVTTDRAEVYAIG